MNSKVYMFPYKHVEKGSKVIIYGLGRCGHDYIMQIEATGWCEIVGVSDQNPESNDSEYVYIPPKDIALNEIYQYIIISLANINQVES